MREVTRELAHQAALARFRIERWHGSSTLWLLSDGSPTSLEVTSDGQWLYNPITLQEAYRFFIHFAPFPTGCLRVSRSERLACA